MLKQKIALVTGAGRGIGQAVVSVMAAHGATVIVTDIDSALAQGTAEHLGNGAAAMTLDVSDGKQVAAVVAEAAERFGRIDILANCAGIVNSCNVLDLTDEVFARVMGINLNGTFYLCREVGRLMKRQGYGKIVNISSQAAKVGEAGNGAYCCSKAAVSMLTQVLALELGASGVNVNAICPGYTDTIIMQQVFEKRGPLEGVTPAEYERQLLSAVPLGRMAKPEEIGELAAFLASERAAYITGVAVTIAGGKTLI